MAIVTLRYWAAAKEAAGISEETIAADTLAGALSAAGASADQDARFRAVLARSSFLIDGLPVGTRALRGRTLAGCILTRCSRRTRPLGGRTLALGNTELSQHQRQRANTEKTDCGTHDVHLFNPTSRKTDLVPVPLSQV